MTKITETTKLQKFNKCNHLSNTTKLKGNRYTCCESFGSHIRDFGTLGRVLIWLKSICKGGQCGSGSGGVSFVKLGQEVEKLEFSLGKCGGRSFIWRKVWR